MTIHQGGSYHEQDPKRHVSCAEIQPIIDALIAAYGSLATPNFHKIYVTMAGLSHRRLIEDLRSNDVDVLETTDENDDVSTQLVAARSGDQVSLGLSEVGPFAAVLHQDGDKPHSWVTNPDDGPTPLAKLVATLVVQAGFRLLGRAVMVKNIKMKRPDGSNEATFYQALFTDSDQVP